MSDKVISKFFLALAVDIKKQTVVLPEESEVLSVDLVEDGELVILVKYDPSKESNANTFIIIQEQGFISPDPDVKFIGSVWANKSLWYVFQEDNHHQHALI